jgi:hypothetical protein
LAEHEKEHFMTTIVRLSVLTALALSMAALTGCATDAEEFEDVETSEAALATPTAAQIDAWAKTNGFSDSAYPLYDAVNGCGSEPPTDLVPDKFYFVSFTDACNNHDRCYNTEGTSQPACDLGLRGDLRAACKSAIGWLNPLMPPAPPGTLWKHDAASLARCYAMAETYFAAVAAVGANWHGPSQVQAHNYNILVNEYITAVTSGSAWKPWLDRDNPSGNGDGEYLSLFDPVTQACAKPLLAECRRVSDKVDFTQTGEKVTCNITDGGFCNNDDQSDKMCDDYEVRFLCPL